jgi:hypothetical protein
MDSFGFVFGAEVEGVATQLERHNKVANKYKLILQNILHNIYKKSG